jgi:hypothetical protein
VRKKTGGTISTAGGDDVYRFWKGLLALAPVAAILVLAPLVPTSTVSALTTGSTGCQAVNAGTWNSTVAGPPTYQQDLPELDFAVGEEISVAITVSAVASSGGGQFILVRPNPSWVISSVYSGPGPMAPTEFTGSYVVTGAGDLQLYASIMAVDHGYGTVTTTSVVSCTPAPAPVLCLPGTFSATGTVPCTPAPPGSFVEGTGAVMATLCSAGTYQDLEGQVACTLAPVGSFVDTEGAIEATPCPAGTFSAVTGAVACTLAPVGSFVDTEGAIEATPCPAGTFSAVTGAVACTLAPVGSFVDTEGAIEATPCPAGETTAGVGSVSADDCFPIDIDGDGDGVADVDDVCPATVLPDAPTRELKKNRFAASLDGFASVDGVVVASLADTGGCSATQIITEAGLGFGHTMFGISRGALRAWIDTVNA